MGREGTHISSSSCSWESFSSAGLTQGGLEHRIAGKGWGSTSHRVQERVEQFQVLHGTGELAETRSKADLRYAVKQEIPKPEGVSHQSRGIFKQC